MSTEIKKRLFTIHDYHRMAEAGILSEDDRVELIYGEILAMSPIGSGHASTVDRANRLMINLVGDKAIVRIQNPVVLDEYDEPQPDIVLLKPREDFYFSAHPGPADILLILEISESSLGYDRGMKAQLYAETGIQEYWILDLKNRCLFAYSDIHEKSYRVVRQLNRGDSIAPLLLPDCQVKIEALFP